MLFTQTVDCEKRSIRLEQTKIYDEPFIKGQLIEQTEHDSIFYRIDELAYGEFLSSAFDFICLK